MHNAANAYGAVAKQIANPRQLEASLLLKAASRLQIVKDEWDARSGELKDALLFNRKLWSVLLTSVTQADHPLPAPIRQNVANLGLYVMNETIVLMALPQREKLGSLININRELAAGLMGRG